MVYQTALCSRSILPPAVHGSIMRFDSISVGTRRPGHYEVDHAASSATLELGVALLSERSRAFQHVFRFHDVQEYLAFVHQASPEAES